MRKIIGLLLMGIGTFSLLFPWFCEYRYQDQADRVIKNFERGRSRISDQLYDESYTYNRKIYEEGQKKLRDAFQYEAAPIALASTNDVFGYLKIPKMNVRLPFYLGATQSNMKKGAAILGGTSLPIGGENTNCVIAAHRGYQGIPYFREIERLDEGDLIILKNPWETLRYQVVSTKVIDPKDIDQIRIQKGKEMVTLLTCHPYRKHQYRYVVYCERTSGKKARTKSSNDSISSSEYDIAREKLLRNVGLVLVFGMFLIIGKKRGDKK